VGLIFHTSALFFLPLYPLLGIEVNLKRFAIMVFAGFCLSLLYNRIQEPLSVVLPEKYQHYVYTSIVKPEQILVYLYQLILFAFCFIQLSDKNAFLKKYSYIAYMFLLGSVMYFFSFYNRSFSRGAFLFSPYIIISVPQMLKTINEERGNATPMLKNSNSNKQTKIFRWGGSAVVLMTLIQYIARLNVNNIGTTMPYRFFFP
jgi:hypothetical protein